VIRFTPFDSNGDGIGEHEIFIQGTLRALGSAAAPIRFTAAAAPQPGSWGAINLMASDGDNRLEFVQIEYAYRGFHAHFATALLRDCELARCVRGAQFQESQVTMERCRLLDNRNGLQFRDARVTLDDLEVRGGYWGIRGVHSQVALHRGGVSENLVNGVNLRDCDGTLQQVVVSGNRRGLYLQQSRITVAGCRLENNSEHGIFLEESSVRITGCLIAGNGRAGVRWVATSGEFLANLLAGNGEYALINDGPDPVVARGNWWGSADPARIALLIRDAADLPEVGPVDATDFLTVSPD